MKLLLDEQISHGVAERLRDRGHDVTAVTEEQSLRGLGDPEVFEVAQAQGRAVVTYNRDDFEAIVREFAEAEREHCGLIVVHPTRFPGQDFNRVIEALHALLERRTPPGKSFLLWLSEAP